MLDYDKLTNQIETVLAEHGYSPSEYMLDNSLGSGLMYDEFSVNLTLDGSNYSFYTPEDVFASFIIDQNLGEFNVFKEKLERVEWFNTKMIGTQPKTRDRLLNVKLDNDMFVKLFVKFLEEVESVKQNIPDKPNVGDKVDIIGGPFREAVGVVLEVDNIKRMATVEVSIFGRDTPVSISFGNLRKVDNS